MNIQSLGCESDDIGCTYWFALSGDGRQGRTIHGVRWDSGHSPYVVDQNGKFSTMQAHTELKLLEAVGITDILTRDPVAEFNEEFNKELDGLIGRLESKFKLEYSLKDGDRELAAKLLRRLRK